MVDAGRSAVTQYLCAGVEFKSLDSIFITHLHADHIADYYNFFLVGGSVTNDSGDNLAGPVHVYGPGSAGALPPPVTVGAPRPLIRPRRHRVSPNSLSASPRGTPTVTTSSSGRPTFATSTP